MISYFYFYISFSSFIIALSSTKQIMEINRDSFKSYMESNKYNNRTKLLLIFYKNNSNFSEEALNIIEKDVAKEYGTESGVNFGKINIDEKSNLWLNLQFNIKRIPYIILIKGNYFYELNQKPDKYSLRDLINLEKEDSEKNRVPDEINTIRKILIIFNLTIKFFRNIFYNIFKIRLNKNIIIFIFIIILSLLIWLIKIFIVFVCSFLCFKSTQKKNIIIKKEKDKSIDLNIIKEGDEDADDSGFSGSELKNNEDEKDSDNDNNSPKLNKDIFKKESDLSEKEILKKYKNKIE